MEYSLREILQQYIDHNRFYDPDTTSYIADFLASEDKIQDFIVNAIQESLENPDLLSCSPEQIMDNNRLKADLEKLIHTYIKLLPFTERVKAIPQFNALFEFKKRTAGYHLYELRRFNENHRPIGGKNYCRTEDLLDSVEIEILLLKRLQKGELELLLNPNGDVDIGRQRNTQQRLADEFCMSRAAIKKHLDKLKYTHNLLGYNLHIPLNDSTIEYGGTSIHPIFLVLNPSEVVLLTVWLKTRFPKAEGRLGELASVLADDVYRQLSEHGKQIVDKKAKDADVQFERIDRSRESVPAHRLEDYETDIAICYKRNVHCTIKLKQTGEKEYTGYLGSRDSKHLELMDKQGKTILQDNMGNALPIKEEDVFFFSVT